jgi:hypothetical protein
LNSFAKPRPTRIQNPRQNNMAEHLIQHRR